MRSNPVSEGAKDRLPPTSLYLFWIIESMDIECCKFFVDYYSMVRYNEKVSRTAVRG